jgi:signal transduction histidine kinase
MQKVADHTDNIFLLVLFAMAGTFLLAISFVFFFIRYQRKMLQQKEAMQKAELEHQEGLLHAALQSQEEERKRIGRDLHDDVGSALSNLRMVLSKTDTDNEKRPLIDNIMTTVRNISHALSPPGLDLFGLEHTLHELCDTFNTSGKLELILQNDSGQEIDAIGKERSLTLYRVIQELLSNTVKHADASKVIISINKENNKVFIVTYKDNGKGMDLSAAKKTSMGMQNIESRLSMIKATYSIDSEPQKGFKITIKLSMEPIL